MTLTLFCVETAKPGKHIAHMFLDHVANTVNGHRYCCFFLFSKEWDAAFSLRVATR